ITSAMTASQVAQAIANAINAANIGVAAQWGAGQTTVQLAGAFNLQMPAPLAGQQLTAQNTINGLFVRINTSAGQSLDTLDVAAEFASTDIPYVLQENLVIHDDLGFVNFGGGFRQRVAGQLTIDPGVIVKAASSRIEAEMGSNLIAEGTAAQPIVFTSIDDSRYGGGGTFDTPSNGGAVLPQAGDWGGFYFWPTSSGSLDHTLITYAGGSTAIEGGFDAFDTVEIHQAKVRVADSTLENNAASGGGLRNGRESSDASVIFVLGAQPSIVNNVIQNNAGAAISVDANSLESNLVPDWGRSTGLIDRFSQFDDNHGPLVRLNKIGGDSINGMVVRAATLETSSIWDDTDIVHVLEGVVVVPNFASVGGLRLQSSATQSLVVKVANSSSGITASGTPLDISDRIGGEVQVLGTPQHPVVLTALKDDSVGAGLTPADAPNNDTNNDGTASKPSPGDWRGLVFDPFSNDRNVAMLNETESALTGGKGTNDTPAAPQSLGQLAPNEQSGDDNSRLGFQVNGYISPDYSQDVDVYTFKATQGTQVWLNLTNTSSALDAVLELVDAQGNVLARSDNSGAEQVNAGNPVALGGGGDPLFAGPLLKSLSTNNLAQPLQSSMGGTNFMNFWSTNPADPGFRVVLPGSAGVHDYYVRVYSKGAGVNAFVPGKGISSGQYQLQVRLQNQVEIPGSTVQYSDIRYATNGIDVEGLPGHSPLVSNSYSQTADHSSRGSAQDLGDLLASDTSSINVGGNLAASTSVEWYKFELTYQEIQVITASAKTWAAVFDVGYADGLTRPDTIIDVYDSNGNLIYTGRDSNVADQQPRPNAGQDASELNHSSFGTLDPYIGTVQMPTGQPGSGTFTYYVAIHSNATLPQALDGTFNANSSSYLVRLEPVDSVNRVVEDHVGSQGGQTAQDPATLTPLWNGDTSSPATITTLNTYATPYNLSDVVLFVSTGGVGGHLETINPFTGGFETDQGQIINSSPESYPTIAMRNDGRLFALSQGSNDGNSGNYAQIDTGTGAANQVGDDGVATEFIQNGSTSVTGANRGVQYNAMAYVQDTPQGNTRRFLYAIGSYNPLGLNGTTQPFDNGIFQLDPNTGAVVPTGAGGINVAPTNVTLPTQPLPVFVKVNGVKLTSETITGLAYLNGTMFAVGSNGGVYRFSDIRTGQATLVANLGVSFTTLTAGPPNVENGRFKDMLFAVGNGSLYAFDGSGQLQNVFSNGQSSISLGGTSVADMAFSTLDYNLWHVTNHRGADPKTTPADAGHGIAAAPDNSRSQFTSNPTTPGGTSFYFGLEKPPAGPIFANDSLNADSQPDAGNYTTNSGLYNTYNLPGGAYGSLSTNSFSLANYSAADKPTLYFNYFLNTEDAQSTKDKLQQMFDSARVMISADGGATWQPLASNNYYTPATFTDPEAERAYYQSVSSATGSGDPLQRVQPLFDSTTSNTGWRQARVDLGDFAGQNNLQLRFDFSTAGTTLNPGDLTINAVTGKANNPYSQDVQGDQFGQFQGGNNNGNGPEHRGLNNSHEGWYIDDIVIGFAERGEMATNTTTGGAAGNTSYVDLQSNPFNAINPFNTHFTKDPNPAAVKQLLTGPYQLEIRRGTEYGFNFSDFFPDIQLYQTFDANDRLSQSYSIVAPAGSGLADGETFTVSDGVHSVTFEFDNDSAITPGNARIAFSSGYTAQQVADAIVAAINSNPTLVKVSAADINNQANGAQGVSNPATNIVNLFGVTAVTNVNASLSSITVSLADQSITESSTAKTGTIRRSGSNLPAANVPLVAVDVTTGLTSTNVMSYPAFVSFAAGQTVATFLYSGVVKGSPEWADGTKTVMFKAFESGFTSAGDTVDVTDDPGVLPTFTVSLPGGNPFVPEGTAVLGMVSVNTGPVSAAQHPGGLVVDLQGLNPGAANPTTTTVTIPVGATSANFTISTINDGIQSHPGNQRTATIIATAAGFISGNVALSVTDVSGGTIPYATPKWTSVGPSPMQDGQAQTPDGLDQTAGAIETVLPDPLRPNVLYAGTVNGGIWKTTNYDPNNPSAAPTWTPLTDNLPAITVGGQTLRPSLSIGALSFDPTDPTNNTIIAGIGRFSSFAFAGGFLGGLLRSTDGGLTWSEISPPELQGQNISGVAERGNIILAGANHFFSAGGLYRSANGGASFTLVSGTNGLPVGPITDLTADPSDPTHNRYFVGVLGTAGGIFMTSDAGATWQNITPAGLTLQASYFQDNIRIATSNASIFFGYIKNGQLANMYYSPIAVSSATWVAMDVPKTNEGGTPTGIQPDLGESDVPGSQGIIHFAIAADPSNPKVVYVGGDRQPGPGDPGGSFPNSIGATNYTGRLFRGDANITPNPGAVPSPQWSEITNDATANDTAPHADSRHLAFDSKGNLFNTNDGGIYVLTSPATTAKTNPIGDWYSTIGNLTIAEMHNVAYDTNTQTAIGGNQDNGSPEQLPGSSIWSTFFGGDGGDVAVDNTTLAGLGESIRYTSAQLLGGFNRATFDAGNNLVSVVFPALTVNGSGGKTIYQLDALPFVTPVVLNAVDPRNLVISANTSIYESTDQGATLTKLGAGGTSDGLFGARIAYGGMLAGVPNAAVLWVGTGNQVLLRTTAGGSLAATNYAGGTVEALTIDPTNWKRAFIADGNGHIWETINGGVSYLDITGSGAGGLLSMTAQTFSAAYVPGVLNGAVYIGTEDGVYELTVPTAGLPSTENWQRYGYGLPGVPVYSMEYVPSQQMLLASTMGRGAFEINAFGQAGDLTATLNVSQTTDDTNSTTLTITRTGSFGPLTVDLASSDPTLANVLSPVTIPDGFSSITIPVNVIDSVLARYPSTVVFTPTPVGFGTFYATESASLDILPDGDGNTPTDNDTPALSLSIPGTTMIPGTSTQFLTATVTRNTPTSSPLVVTLASLNPSVATVPATVTIPAGQATASFTISAVQQFSGSDITLFGLIVAAADGYSSSSGLVSTDSRAAFIQYNPPVPSAQGDVTMPRPQGEVILYGNQISNASQNGILVKAPAPGTPFDSPPDSNASLPHPGGLVNTPTLNGSHLAPGVVIINNLIYGVGQNGISFQGNSQPAGAPQSVVPFGRIVNNTIYGGDNPTGTGILVTNNSSPTILNNVLVNLASGRAINVTGGASAVLGENFYQNSGAAPVNIGLGSFDRVVTTAGPSPFRNASTDPATANFYLTDTAIPIDSSINSLQDRTTMTSVTGPIGIPPSPIIAPGFDLYGELRIDDPAVTNANLGAGQNVFIDRGAIEHTDTTGPTAALLAPIDNDQSDLNTAPNIVFVRGESLSEFTIQLNDGSGAGIFDASANDPARVDVRQDGRLLTPGVDYTYAYDNNNHVIRLIALSGVWLNGHQYDIYLDNGVQFDPGNPAATPVGIADRAGNKLQANGPDGLTHFRLLLGNLTNSAPVVQLVSSGTGTPSLSMYENDNAASPTSATFSLTTPFSSADNTAVALTIFDVDANGGSETLTLSAAHGTLKLSSQALIELASIGVTPTGDGTSTITISAPLGEASAVAPTPGLNAALEGLVFIPDLNFDSHLGDQAAVTVTIDDNGNSPAPGQTAVYSIPINVIAVNDAPVTSVPASSPGSPIGINEDTPLTFSSAGGNAVTIADSDITAADLNNALLPPFEEIITVNPSNLGTLTIPNIAGITFTGGTSNGQSRLDFLGTLAAINQALDGLIFEPAEERTGAVQLTVITNDHGNIGVGPAPQYLPAPQPLSSTTQTVYINILPVVDAPTLNTSANLTFQPVVEDTPPASNLGSTVLAMLQSDPLVQPNAISLNAPGAQYGIAVTGMTETANGLWQYKSPLSATWTPFPAVSNTRALLIDANDSVRFLPNPKFDDTRGPAPTISFVAWDHTYDLFNGGPDADGAVVDLTQTGTGGSTPFSLLSAGSATATLHVTPAAEAPTLAAAAALAFNSINEDELLINNNGSTILTMLQSDPNNQPNAITLHAAGTPRYGIAVTGLTQTANGVWQYQIGGGWANISLTVSSTSALLLDGNDSIRFLPNPKFDNTRGGAPTLTFVAWDETFDFVNGIYDLDGSTVNLSTTGQGGSTPFSSASAVASLSVNPLPEAPTLKSGAALSLATINEDVAPINNLGGAVLGMLQSDPNSLPNAITLNAVVSPQFGIAVVGLGQTANGTWQYQLPGGAWTAFPTVSTTSALLLDGGDLLRFLPNANFNDFYGGPATLSFVAWDETFDYVNGRIDTHGQTVDLTSTGTGGSTPFSAGAPAVAKLSVRAVNDAPTVGGPSGPVALSPSSAFSLSTAALPAFTVADVDLPEGNQQMQVTINTSENGVAGGAVGLTQLTGITIVSGANNTANVTFKGSITNVLAALANLVYEQDINFNGTASLTLIANDLGNSGLGPQGQPAPFPLSSAPFTATLTGVPIHRAPVLGSGSPSLPAILENVPPANTAPAGTSISAMLATAGANFLTVDTAAGGQQGIAVTAVAPSTGGVWQYSANGTSWTTIAGVALNQALLLPASDQLRFWPNPGYAGVASITFYGWDQVVGTAGSTADLSGPGATGGFSSFSTTSATATLNVQLVNQPPLFTLATNQSVLENNTVTANGGSPGGSNAAPISLTNFVTGISPGQPIEIQSPFSQTVTFTVTTDRPDLFSIQPMLD
ncbi:MAG TPA: hypothetical protein VHC19_12905, partial [Pirellulales bacterium]|nr:hypothetical protein [Pirellulales bacterium]